MFKVLSKDTQAKAHKKIDLYSKLTYSLYVVQIVITKR